MARAALMALAWAAAAAAASAARYVDYSGVKMPQYGPGDYDSPRDLPHLAAAADDYHGHSPDASASLDYKFEEDIHGKSERPPKESDDRKSWSKFARRHRELERLRDDENLETLDRYDPEPEEISKIKINHRLPVLRTRLRSRKSRKEGSSRQRTVKHRLNRNDPTDSDIEYIQGREATHEANGKDIEVGVDGYRHTPVTERIIRRKPRDRHIRGRLGDDREDAFESSRRMTADRSTESEYLLHDEDRERMNDREHYRPVLEDEDAALTGRRSKAYDNYGDYYDMKRVHNIKKKLPTLLRRTSARVMPPTVTSTNVLDALWTHRRSVPAAPPALAGAALSVVPLPPSSAAPVATASLWQPASTVSTSRGTVVTQAAQNNISAVISLAEKSRLSILKKAQRKESVHNDSSTAKPPVLLQVTDKRLTVVVVEPPSSEGPWMRAREVAADTPERVERAKRLMRRKLVARARNIQELTDNWDEMVCDYIDVSLLDAGPLAVPPLHHVQFLLAFAILLLLM
ncbi:hypothetical protein O3G_MSEX012913 [Manduca sexta]|uniref:Uncharacterized protein n=1 Tax=Manduca sexta TaxID=7130 RepID=A0A922CXH4_MANSE|nr:hypothetical protein O3G_MSEX012913 [Manduca sexta]